MPPQRPPRPPTKSGRSFLSFSFDANLYGLDDVRTGLIDFDVCPLYLAYDTSVLEELIVLKLMQLHHQQPVLLWVALLRPCLQSMRSHQLHGASEPRPALHVVERLLYLVLQHSEQTCFAGLLFFQLMFMSFRTLFVALFTFPNEFKMLLKERASGMYRLSAFYFARTASVSSLCLLNTVRLEVQPPHALNKQNCLWWC